MPRPMLAVVQPEQRIEFDLGSLILELPGGTALPARGSLELDVAQQSYRVALGKGRSAFARQLEDGRRFQFDLLPVGTHEIHVRLLDDASKAELVPRPDGRLDFRKPDSYETRASATIARGATAGLKLM